LADATVLAYLAGVIDSDGYITVHRSVRNGKAYYAARIGVTGTRREPHDLAASLWGGTVCLYQPKTPGHRTQFQWSRTGDPAVGPIVDVQPYLRIKQEQARIALEAQEHVISGRGDDPYPWMLPDYDPGPYLTDLRDEMVFVLNQGRQIAGRELDGRTWDEFPAVTS
jgi:hypothetical protein